MSAPRTSRLGARRLETRRCVEARFAKVTSSDDGVATRREGTAPVLTAWGLRFNLSVARFGASDCAFLRGACCASDQLAHVLAKGRSLKRRDLFTIHPQQGRLVRADHLFRGSPFFGSLLRHGTP